MFQAALEDVPVVPDVAVLESRELHNRGFSGAVGILPAGKRTAK